MRSGSGEFSIAPTGRSCDLAWESHGVDRLLKAHGIDAWAEQPDLHFVQGALQLALASCADEFLPEIIGFNLEYEQLPLHLLITAFERTSWDSTLRMLLST